MKEASCFEAATTNDKRQTKAVTKKQRKSQTAKFKISTPRESSILCFLWETLTSHVRSCKGRNPEEAPPTFGGFRQSRMKEDRRCTSGRAPKGTSGDLNQQAGCLFAPE